MHSCMKILGNARKSLINEGDFYGLLTVSVKVLDRYKFYYYQQIFSAAFYPKVS